MYAISCVTVTYLLFHVSEMADFTALNFAWTGMPLFHAVVMEASLYIRDEYIWSQETRNIPLSYGADHISIS